MCPLPEPPPWAVAAGLPAPLEGERFVPYVRRLGLDPEPLLEDLTERTADLANYRLATRLQHELPIQFRAHVASLAEKYIEPGRRRMLRYAARGY